MTYATAVDTAPEAPRNRKVTFKAGLLACGSTARSPSRVLPVALWTRLTAHSCGGSCGFGPGPFRIPFSSALARENLGRICRSKSAAAGQRNPRRSRPRQIRWRSRQDRPQTWLVYNRL